MEYEVSATQVVVIDGNFIDAILSQKRPNLAKIHLKKLSKLM